MFLILIYILRISSVCRIFPPRVFSCFRYQSIAYGLRNVDQEKPIIIDTESREALGGKRAAIQYYFDKNGLEREVGA